MAEPTDPVSEVPVVPEEPVAGPEPTEPESAEPEVVEAVPTGELAAAETERFEPAVAGESPAAREVVYVQAPVPPPARHNRGFGVLISLLGAVAFALLYVAAAAIVFSFTPHTVVDSTFTAFLASDAFWVPVAAYAVFSVLFALIVNRAAWWAHVIGSLFVATLTYGASLGVLALMRGVIAMTPDAAVALLGSLAAHPLLLCVLALARESSLWFGLAIASRGRRVRERNATERALFEQSVADRRAEYERAHPSS